MAAHRPPVRIAEHGRPTHTLLHLSDTHLVGDGLLCDTLDATARLRRTLERITSSGVRPDAVVITGDLADEGEPAAYRELRSLVVPWVERLGAELVWVMGNHDDRGVLRGVLLDGGDPRPGPQPPLDEVRDLAGLRLVTLDTTVPGHHHGALEPAQLRWLAEVLAEPAPHGTVLALHHPPVPAVQDLAVLVELRGQPALAEVLRGSDVRAILGGHLHHSCSATFAGIPVSVAAATCYTQDLTVPGAGTRGRDAAQAYHLVQVHTDTVLHVVVPLDEGDTVGRPSDAADTARRLADAGVIIPAAAPTAPRRQTPSTSQGARTGK